ncbi:MAG: signal peptidase I [Clostridia bacterium]|nr:signal peptidase I [Clostridia bacterium]
MTRDRKVLYISVSSLFAALLIPLFLTVSSGRIIAAALLLLALVILPLINKKRAIPSIYGRDVLLIVSVISVLYLVLIYVIGAYLGFVKSPVGLNLTNFFSYLLPITLIIVSSELIRAVVLAYDSLFPSALCYLALVLGEVYIHSTLKGIYSFNSFMDFVGIYLFPAIISGFTYQYLSRRYGPMPNIVYRLVTTLYFYIIPWIPNLPDSINAIISLLTPLFAYAFVDMLFERKVRRALKKKGPVGYILTGGAVAVMVAFVMLISCQFRFGALIIATESMTGEINKGDAIIYDTSEDITVTEGQVIVFSQKGNKVVHRVDGIEVINNETRYYTKGDANEDRDPGYITSGSIEGVVKLKLPGVGYPTLWLRDLVNKALK